MTGGGVTAQALLIQASGPSRLRRPAEEAPGGPRRRSPGYALQELGLEGTRTGRDSDWWALVPLNDSDWCIKAAPVEAGGPLLSGSPSPPTRPSGPGQPSGPGRAFPSPWSVEVVAGDPVKVLHLAAVAVVDRRRHPVVVPRPVGQQRLRRLRLPPPSPTRARAA